MMKKVIICTVAFVIIVLAVGAHYWINTQPLAVVETVSASEKELPETNRKIIQLAIEQGKLIAPTYDTAVCTEFVIQIMEHIKTLSRQERKLVRIITDKNLVELIKNDSAIVKGLQTALLYRNKGFVINQTADVLPGDFVQFWNLYGNAAYGHCGIVHTVEAGESITVYSSHPFTNGYGIQKFNWPDKVYFARMN